MPSLSGGQNRAYPTLRREITPSGFSDPASKPPITVKVPAGSDSLAAGSTLTGTTSLGMDVTDLQVDIPASVTGWIEFDGQRVHESSDGQGSVGLLRFGDLAAGKGRRVNSVRFSFTNNAAAARNVRYWLTGLPS